MASGSRPVSCHATSGRFVVRVGCAVEKEIVALRAAHRTVVVAMVANWLVAAVSETVAVWQLLPTIARAASIASMSGAAHCPMVAASLRTTRTGTIRSIAKGMVDARWCSDGASSSRAQIVVAATLATDMAHVCFSTTAVSSLRRRTASAPGGASSADIVRCKTASVLWAKRAIAARRHGAKRRAIAP